jgi:pimeloyl-ACP methyl ester carboxylesterase
MAQIVLVHGAWGGSYSFGKVRRMLLAEGHEVFTPSLTGIGERSHLIHPGVGLNTHIRDVVNTGLYEDLTDILLLGFSYGGMVISGALEHIGDRVKHLVYLDAFVPADGDSVRSISGMGRDVRQIDPHHSWLLKPAPRELDSEADTQWMEARRSMQPLLSFTETVHLQQPVDQGDYSLCYIKATTDADEKDDSGFWRAARHARESSDWTYHEIATNHMIPSNRPRELAEILVAIASN